MKSIITTLSFFFISIFFKNVSAQSFSFPGTRMGNYTGVQSVYFNPAQVADSRYTFDLNVVGLNAGLGNNKASFSLNSVFSTLNSNNALNSLFSGDGRISGQLNVDILGPSLLVSLPKKSGLAFTSRLRAQFTISDLDGKLAKSIPDDFNLEVTLPYTVSSGNNMRINTNGWAEYGVTYGKVIKEEGEHFLKAGATLKYLSGAGNSYIQLDQISGTIIQDPNPANPTILLAPGSRGVIGLGISGNMGSITPSSLLKSSSNGFGADVGVVYEYRPGKNRKHPYKFKASASLLDIGSITYDRDLTKSGTYTMLVTTLPGFNLQTLQGVSLDNYKQVLSANPNFTAAPNNNDPTLKVSLPTTLQLYGDVHVKNNLYLSAGTQISLSNRSNPENPLFYSGFTITPRYEGKGVGLYVPINYNPLTQLTMGTTLRLGPVFVGSGSILSALFSQSKQADVHIGMHIGVLKKTKTKIKEAEPADDQQ
ncbi:MAG: DUF5723 family protein [Bacteroidota bacterium]